MRLDNSDIPGLRRYDADETGASKPWFWYGAMALDGTVAPWSEAPVRSLYLYTSGSTAVLYVKTVDNNAAADWTNLALAGEAETLAGIKTFTAKPVVLVTNTTANGVTDVLSLGKATSGTPAAGIGAGIQVNIQDAGGSEEQARINFALSDKTSTSEDCDMTLQLNIAGGMTTVMFVDADEGGAGGSVLLQLGTDAKPVKLDIHPPTTASGTLRISAADSAGDTVTEIVNASQAGARTYTVPDAGASASFMMTQGAQTVVGAQTFSAVPTVTIDNAANNAVTDMLVLNHTTSGSPAAGIGAGVQFKVEDAGGTEEQARINVSLSSVTDGAEDADLAVQLNVAGAMKTVLAVDADEGGAGGATLLQVGSDAVPVAVDIHPLTTAKGTLRLVAADSAGDTVTTLTNASQAAARVYTVPDAGADADFVMDEVAQTIGGVKTFSAIPIFPATGIAFDHATADVSVVATNPSGARVLTIPEPGGDASFVMTEGAQTVNGAKTFGSAIKSAAGVGAIVAGKCTAVEYGDGVVHQTVLTLTLSGANDIDLADGADHGASVTIYDMPAGRILLLGATCDLSAVVNDAFNASPNDVFNVAVGSVAADDADGLSGTEVNIIPASALDTVGNTTLTLPWKSALAASAQFDGTTSAMAVIVNATVADASTTKAVTLAITGTLTLTWINLGDY